MNSQFLRYFALTFIGLANALPVPFMGSTLSIWLAEAGYGKDVIGLFALLGIPFSLKIFWLPVINYISCFCFIGRQRKMWLLFALGGISCCLLGMSFWNSAMKSWVLVINLLFLSMFTGCLYIIGIAYELESLPEKNYSKGSAFVITGYRLGLLIAGGGALYLSFLLGWSWMFRGMAFILAIGGGGILCLPEPYKSKEVIDEKRRQFSQYETLFKGFWNEAIFQPCRLFLMNPQFRIILILILTFKVGDELAKSMQGPFYLSLGFSKVDIASASKMWGMLATVMGAFIFGYFFKEKDPFFSVIKMGFIHSLSLVCYGILSLSGKSFAILYITVALENLTGGMAITAFIAFLWKVCDKRYAAAQYALFWSILTFKADVIACLGGFLANSCTWNIFFLIVSTVGLLSSLIPWGFLKFFSRTERSHQNRCLELI